MNLKWLWTTVEYYHGNYSVLKPSMVQRASIKYEAFKNWIIFVAFFLKYLRTEIVQKKWNGKVTYYFLSWLTQHNHNLTNKSLSSANYRKGYIYHYVQQMKANVPPKPCLHKSYWLFWKSSNLITLMHWGEK